jgi:hypothetical protein
MRNDSPPDSWYEPADLIEDDDPEPVPDEPLVIAAGLVWWRRFD